MCVYGHTVPHLKALTHGIERRGGHGRGSTFKQRYTVMKSTINGPNGGFM